MPQAVQPRGKTLRAQLPPGGVAIGEQAIREAVERSFSQIEELINAKLRAAMQLAGDEDPWVWVVALFADAVVVKRDGKFYRYGYTASEHDVTLGDATEVLPSWSPVAGDAEGLGVGSAGQANPEPAREAQGLPGPLVRVVEAGDGKPGLAFEIRVIRAGLSGNANYYPDAVLREAVPLFDGARVLVKSDDEHLSGRGKSVRNLVGRLSEARFVEGTGPDSGEIRARLDVISAESPEARMMREAVERGLGGLFGFSIDAACKVARTRRGGASVREAKQFLKVSSVDLIVEPGAGGEVLQLLEAQSPDEEDNAMWRAQLIEALQARGLLKTGEAESLTDDELKTRLTEALADPEPASPGPAEPQDAAPAAGAPVALREALEVLAGLDAMREAIAASALPAPAKARLRSRFEQQVLADGLAPSAEAVREAIEAEADYLGGLAESGRVRGLGQVAVTPGESRFEKTQQMLEAFFDPDHAQHRHAQSLKACYVAMTGDARVTGHVKYCDEALMREALGSQTLSDVLGDAITRRLQQDYRTQSQYDIWRRVAEVTNVGDFRTQERTQFGGYGDFPIVGEGAPYLEVDTPTDFKATYAVQKRGGTESITLETIKNDDAGVVRRIPIKFSRAAKRTVSKFALDFLATNPVIYDGLTLFHATHGNLGTAALDAAALAARRLAMKEQTEPGSGDKLSIPAKSLLVPDALEETAVDLFKRNTENDKTFVQSLTLDILPVWYWTDANNWFLAADPMDIPTIEIAFLDGQEEPEIFIQDSPTSGSMFSNDKLTWKLRHIYGGNVLDWRGLQGSIVA